MSNARSKFWWEEPDVDFAKVTYRTLDGFMTQAYIDLHTGLGENKHTDEFVKVVWSDEHSIWMEVEQNE